MNIYSILTTPKIFIPYTYIIKFKPTGQFYYGVSYANSLKISNPKQLWNTYFTSSKIIHILIEEYGLCEFEVQIRKTFTSAEKARKWELKVLRRINAYNSNLWLNGIGTSFEKMEIANFSSLTILEDDNLKSLQSRYKQLNKILLHKPKDKTILKEKSILMKKISVLRKLKQY